MQENPYLFNRLLRHKYEIELEIELIRECTKKEGWNEELTFL